jgi:hypothetical protein
VPTAPTATAITSTTATVGWTGVTGSIGYDYVVNTSPGNPSTGISSTTATSAPVTGLLPSTNYYLHVRNKCSSTSISIWIHHPFTTLPPCEPPIGFHTTDLTPTSAGINWAAWPSALSYDYLVDQNRADPVGSTGLLNTTAISASIPSGLLENTWYYVHIRSRCAANEISDWMLDSFLTPIVCRAPQLNVEHLNTDEAVTYWDAVPTAYQYEYVIDQSASDPAVGTKYAYTSIHTSALKDGVTYYVHVRSNCESVGVKSSSPWATTSFKTFALGIGNTTTGPLRLSIFPNPVTDKMHIQFSGKRDGAAIVTITDVAGRTVKIVDVTADDMYVDMSTATPGTYLLKYKDQSHTKMIKLDKK